VNNVLIRRVSGAAIHHPQRLAIVSDDPAIGEICRAQTEAKALLVVRALELLARYERGELFEAQQPPVQIASD
jgi:hypothetical protein